MFTSPVESRRASKAPALRKGSRALVAPRPVVSSMRAGRSGCVRRLVFVLDRQTLALRAALSALRTPRSGRRSGSAGLRQGIERHLDDLVLALATTRHAPAGSPRPTRTGCPRKRLRWRRGASSPTSSAGRPRPRSRRHAPADGRCRARRSRDVGPSIGSSTSRTGEMPRETASQSSTLIEPSGRSAMI